MQRPAPLTSARNESGLAASMTTPMMQETASPQPHYAAARRSVFARLRQRWLQFQQRRMLRCRVFVIPCVAVRDAGGSGDGFAVARPVFDMIWLRPLQRLADAHPRFYVGFGICFLAVPNFYCLFIFTNETRGVSTLVLTMLVCIMMVGFLSSKRYGLDGVAAKHVVLSFRFAVLVALLATDTALYARRVYTIGEHPTVAVSNAFKGLAFCLFVLLDCSPHLPALAQIFISVNARKVVVLQFYFPQHLAGRCLVLFWASGDFECRIQIGS
jgi:hypothetical protein